jgi:hypothetical protein
MKMSGHLHASAVLPQAKELPVPFGPLMWIGEEIIIIFLSGIGPRFRGLKIAAHCIYYAKIIHIYSIHACTHTYTHTHTHIHTYIHMHTLKLQHTTYLNNIGEHNLARANHCCGSRKLPAKHNIQALHMHTRLTVNGVVKDLRQEGNS